MSSSQLSSHNIAIGENTLVNVTNGSLKNVYNIAIGSEAGNDITIGERNILIGAFSGDVITEGIYNSCLGYGTLSSNVDSDKNTAIGSFALNVMTGTAGDTYNTAVGWEAGADVTTGVKNTIIGAVAGNAGSNDLTTGDNNIIIGFNASASAAGVDNEITLGDANISAFRCADQSIAALSDGRDKTNVKDSSFGLDFIDSVRPVEFEWDFRPEHMSEVKQGKKRVGFIAQELQEAMPDGENEILDLVYEISENRIEAKYGNLIPILVKAVQELSAKVKELENK